MKTCKCKAYPFPHRMNGGKCDAGTLDDYQPTRIHRRPIDERLDDPRRGQAKDLNALRP